MEVSHTALIKYKRRGEKEKSNFIITQLHESLDIAALESDMAT